MTVGAKRVFLFRDVHVAHTDTVEFTKTPFHWHVLVPSFLAPPHFLFAEIYPGIATEPVGGTGLKTTGSDAPRS